MNLENLSKKAVYGAISQSKPLQKMPFHPVGPGVDQTLNSFITFERKRIDGMRIQVKRKLPQEIWQKIWDCLDQKGKLNLGSLSHSFEYICQYVQLKVCHKKLMMACSKKHNMSQNVLLDSFYVLIKKICEIRENTKVDAVKMRVKELLESSKGEIQMFIDENESSIKSEWHYTQTTDYKKLKYLKLEFNKLDACNVWCIECKDECYDTGRDWLRPMLPYLCSICCPCLICCVCIIDLDSLNK